MWKNVCHRHIMCEESRAGGQAFIMFISMVINDTTFLLDESLSALADINKVPPPLPEWQQR